MLSDNAYHARRPCQSRFARKKNERWIGWQGDVLIDESVKMAIIGRNYAYKPCLISNEVLTPEKQIGSVVRVKIFGATASTLRAKPDLSLRGQEKQI